MLNLTRIYLCANPATLYYQFLRFTSKVTFLEDEIKVRSSIIGLYKCPIPVGLLNISLLFLDKLLCGNKLSQIYMSSHKSVKMGLKYEKYPPF